MSDPTNPRQFSENNGVVSMRRTAPVQSPYESAAERHREPKQWEGQPPGRRVSNGVASYRRSKPVSNPWPPERDPTEADEGVGILRFLHRLIRAR